MSLSPVAFFGLLDELNPKGNDSRTISDDQHRNILASMKQQAPNWSAAITSTHGDLNTLAGYVAAGKKPRPGEGGITVEWFYNSTVPVGYTLKVLDTNLRNLSIAPGGATPVGAATIAGADDPSSMAYTKDVTPAGTNATADLAHIHNVTGSTGAASGTQNANIGGLPVASTAHNHAVNFNSGAMSANEVHGHVFSGVANSVDIDFDPRRAMGILGILDA